jgi:hypothetical protein
MPSIVGTRRGFLELSRRPVFADVFSYNFCFGAPKVRVLARYVGSHEVIKEVCISVGSDRVGADERGFISDSDQERAERSNAILP